MFTTLTTPVVFVEALARLKRRARLAVVSAAVPRPFRGGILEAGGDATGRKGKILEPKLPMQNLSGHKSPLQRRREIQRAILKISYLRNQSSGQRIPLLETLNSNVLHRTCYNLRNVRSGHNSPLLGIPEVS